jgi:heat shock protein 4
MYLGKLRDITAVETKLTPSDVVISVPGWYNDIQRRAILDASHIAGLNPLRLINDTTAIALGYGITKQDLPEPDSPRYVVFVDIGHSNYSVAVVAFAKGQLSVKSTAYDRQFGGRNIDLTLVKHFAVEFKEKYKIDVMANPKAIFRLITACEKLKKVLSANAEAPLSVESIMNDVDASSKMNREQFEDLIAEPLSRIHAPLEEALREAGLTPDQIHSVELVGGSTRIPAIRNRLREFFGGASRQLSSTLNADEAICRGATFACAMLSPVFRVRDFNVQDITPYPIKTSWERAPGDADEDDTELVVFPRGNNIPSTKVLTFYRSAPFELEASYAEPSKVHGPSWIGSFQCKNVVPNANGDPVQIKVKSRLNLHGILSFEGAQLIEEELSEPEPPAEGAEGEAAKPRKLVKKTDLPVITRYTSLEPEVLERLRESENSMYAADKLVADTEVSTHTFHQANHNQDSTLICRTVKTHSRSTCMTCAESSMSDLHPLFFPRKSPRSLLSHSRLRTGCTLRKARTQPSLRTSSGSMGCTHWATRSPRVTASTRRARVRRHSCARPSAHT